MRKPILIQGAMDYEIGGYLALLENAEPRELSGYSFCRGDINGVPVIVSLTGVGMVNAAAATVLGVKEFAPAAVINQGTAGAHREELALGDIVVGDSAVDINCFVTRVRPGGGGCGPMEWEYAKRSVQHRADTALADLLWAWPYNTGVKHRGVLGSGDIFNREADRIRWIAERRGTWCEDMESAAVYHVCGAMGIPCAGVRVISNNELRGSEYRKDVADYLQEFVSGLLSGLKPDTDAGKLFQSQNRPAR